MSKGNGKLRLEYVDPQTLAENPSNWRTHSDGQLAALGAVIEDVGWAGALLYNEATGRLIDGHARKKIATEDAVPVLIGSWTEEQERKILATLDPLAAMADANQQALGELLAQVETDNEALQEMLDGLAAEHGIDLCEPVEEQDPEPQIDRAAELAEEWGTAPGQLWTIEGQAGVHRLLCGDSTEAEDVERLMGGREAACVIADPPYGVSFERGKFISDSNRIASTGVPSTISGDDRRGDEQRAFIATAFKRLASVCTKGSAVYMYSAPLAEGCQSLFGLLDAGVHVQSQLIWEKNNHVLGQADHHWKHEVCWYGWYPGASHRWRGGRDKFTVLKCDRVQATLHPNEKPVGLAIGFLENSTKPGDVIVDPFTGSGTTTCAGETIGREVFGIELDEKYLAIALQRMKDMGLNPKLAEPKP